MKKFLVKGLPWILLVVLLIVGIVFGTMNTRGYAEDAFMTEREAMRQAAYMATLKENASVLGDVELVKTDFFGNYFEGNYVTERYLAKADGEVVGSVYIVKAKSANIVDQQWLTVEVVYKSTPLKSDFAIVNFQVLEAEDADYYNTYTSLTGKTYIQRLADINLLRYKVESETYLETYANISGASYTTKGIVNALKTARLQAYFDYGKDAPAPKLKATQTSVSQDLSNGNYNEFKHDITLFSDNYNNQQMYVYTTYNYENKTFTISYCTHELNDDEKAEVLKRVTLPTMYITDYTKTAELSTATIVTVNSFGAEIKVQVSKNATTITEVKILSQAASDSRGGYDYTTMQTNASNIAISDVDSITAISGATVTSNAIIDAIKLAISLE